MKMEAATEDLASLFEGPKKIQLLCNKHKDYQRLTVPHLKLSLKLSFHKFCRKKISRKMSVISVRGC